MNYVAPTFDYDDQLVNYDGAWFVVLLAVLLTLAFTVLGALAVWCVTVKGKRFTGNWNWEKWGVSINVECA